MTTTTAHPTALGTVLATALAEGRPAKRTSIYLTSYAGEFYFVTLDGRRVDSFACGDSESLIAAYSEPKGAPEYALHDINGTALH
jgi:hypothetical protein